MRARPRFVLPSLLAAAALIAAACTGSGDAGSTTTAAPTSEPAATGASPEPLTARPFTVPDLYPIDVAMAPKGVDLQPLKDPPAAAPLPDPSRPIVPADGIGNIDHFVFIVQENRSFDHYFGTFPGADGIPMKDGVPTTCAPDPLGGCHRPYHDTNFTDGGGPHTEGASITDVDGGKMDGFVEAFRRAGDRCTKHPTEAPCPQASNGPRGQPDVMGYHTGAEIPNYWAYAKTYGLHDHMFAPTDSWTLPSHLFLVSAWSASCSDPNDAMSCSSDLKVPGNQYGSPPGTQWSPSDGTPRPYVWGDVTWLLYKHGIQWAYFVGPGTCEAAPCGDAGGKTVTADVQNPLPGFTSVATTGQLDNIRPNTEFFEAAQDGNLPAVSWVMPTIGVGEHPPDSIAAGQAWVTKVVNAVMTGPPDQWLHTAIFITWDDWGGFYDHVKPQVVDENGWGLRVPDIMIGPFVRRGVSHQLLTFDAYLKLVEDRFLESDRIDPKTDGWPDSRPTVREDVPILGDLAKDFDFSQDPIPPLVLNPWPSKS